MKCWGIQRRLHTTFIIVAAPEYHGSYITRGYTSFEQINLPASRIKHPEVAIFQRNEVLRTPFSVICHMDFYSFPRLRMSLRKAKIQSHLKSWSCKNSLAFVVLRMKTRNKVPKRAPCEKSWRERTHPGLFQYITNRIAKELPLYRREQRERSGQMLGLNCWY